MKTATKTKSKKKAVKPIRNIKRLKKVESYTDAELVAEIERLEAKTKALIKKTIADQKTLLSRFMREKYLNYEELQRMRPRKGDLIAFSSTKYFATLYMLTNHKHKTIAKKLKISCSLLNKWRTETRFKELVLKHHDEFISFFFKEYVFARRDMHHKSHADLKKKTFQELSKLDIHSYQLQVYRKHNISYEMLSDLKGYSDLLISLLISRLEAYSLKAKSKADLPLLGEIGFIFFAIRHHRGWDDEDLAKQDERVCTKASNIIVDITTDLISKPKMSGDDKKEALIALKTLKRPEDEWYKLYNKSLK